MIRFKTTTSNSFFGNFLYDQILDPKHFLVRARNEIKQTAAMVNSYYGHFRQASCYRLRKNLYEKHFGELKKYLKPEKDLSFFSPLEPAG